MMSRPEDRDKRFAILIDADNISEKYVKIILDEVSNLGVATYKRIYGDWTNQRLVSWKGVLLENSIIPMQQYSYTYGKSSTDSAMIIDAMDILYSGNVDGFAIVSSDSDFTRLAARLRESGMQVIGMGEQKTPEPFISACNQFKYLDLLYAARRADEDEGADDASDDADESSTSESQAADTAARKQKRRKRTAKSRARTEAVADASGTEQEQEEASSADDEAEEVSGAAALSSGRPRRHPGDAGGAAVDVAGEGESETVDFGEMSRAARRRHMKRIRTTVNAIIDQFSDDEGWVALGRVGDELSKRLPDFDVRNYGFKKLRPFLKSLGVYEFDEPADASGRRQIYLRLREDA